MSTKSEIKNRLKLIRKQIKWAERVIPHIAEQYYDGDAREELSALRHAEWQLEDELKALDFPTKK